jgi:ribose-phosphate pyrophosphokinase
VNAIIFALPGNEKLADALALQLRAERGELLVRRFPDEESHVRFATEVSGRSVVLVCSLDRPDQKLLQLAFAADAARDLGAVRVGVVAPYLAYMRQDMRFQPGEAITSGSFARIISGFADWLLCVDPHLHRHLSLREIYSIPAWIAHAAPAMAKWISTYVRSPVIIGPDSESEQWVSEVARLAVAPYAVLEKVRKGDTDVEVTMAHPARWREHTPVLVDDIISSAGTMIAAVKFLRDAGVQAPVCVGVHAIFAGDAYQRLRECAADVITCNTVMHPSNAIDVAPLMAELVRPNLR